MNRRQISPDLEDVLPNLFIFRELLDVIDGKHVGHRGANFFERLHVRVGRSFSGLSMTSLLSIFHHLFPEVVFILSQIIELIDRRQEK
jgi:hypothetical protein